jgi:hypothetical protein
VRRAIVAAIVFLITFVVLAPIFRYATSEPGLWRPRFHDPAAGQLLQARR